MSVLITPPVPAQDWRDKSYRWQGDAPRMTPSTRPGQMPEATPDADRWQTIVAEVVALQHLGDNWDGLSAVAPARELLESAVGLAYVLCENGMAPPSAVAPGLDGTVTFEWQAPDGTFCEVEIDRPFHAEVMLIEPGKPARHRTLPTE